MKHRPHVRSGIATRSPSHEGRGDDARRSVGDVSSDPRFRATYFERGVPSVQSSGLDASRQAARAVGRRKVRSARRRRSRRDACGRRALRAEPARAASIRYIPRRQGASTRGWRLRTGPTNGRRVLFLVSIQRAPRGRRVWLEDLLAGNRRLWLMDESMEASASKDVAFGMRVFDAGEFHVEFGIAAPWTTRRPSSALTV